jgi:hypothetical protein
MAKGRNALWAGPARIAPFSIKEHEEIARKIKKERERLRKVYPEVHGEVVEFITHGVSDGTLYVSVRFADNTSLSIR